MGVVLALFGVWLAFNITNEPLWVYIYPVGIILMGIALIIYWRSEDIVEQRKDIK